MNRKERLELEKKLAQIIQMFNDVYSGILFHHRGFASDRFDEISYDFDCPEFSRLREMFNLEAIAGRGSDFSRAKRLMHNFAPRLIHSSWYDNHVPFNALDLLEYALDRKENGINCLSKSKILEECCLALGIYARRVSIMPFSPYDFDNHVVTEIYDRKRKKWIMLDITTDGYFVDESKMPLSVLEIRDAFAHGRFVTFAPAVSRLTDLQSLQNKYADTNQYICKNMFYFVVGKQSGFGLPKDWLTFCPEHYSIVENRKANLSYRIRKAPPEAEQLISLWESSLKDMDAMQEPEKTDIQALQKAPYSRKKVGKA